MTRPLQTNTVYAMAAATIPMVYLVDLEFDLPTGTLRLTNAYADITYGGYTYLRSGHLLDIGDVEENAALMVTELSISFSGVDQAMTSLLLNENYLDRTVRVRRAFLNDGTGTVRTVEPYFVGRMNLPTISEDPDAGTSTIAVSVTSIWVDFERSPGRQTNHENQQMWFPGDRGFEMAGQVFDKLPWGKQ